MDEAQIREVQQTRFAGDTQRREPITIAAAMTGTDAGSYSVDAIKVNLLMDIRDELKRLNGILHCSNFTGIPSTLRSIRRAMPAKPKRTKR